MKRGDLSDLLFKENNETWLAIIKIWGLNYGTCWSLFRLYGSFQGLLYSIYFSRKLKQGTGIEQTCLNKALESPGKFNVEKQMHLIKTY